MAEATMAQTGDLCKALRPAVLNACLDDSPLSFEP